MKRSVKFMGIVSIIFILAISVAIGLSIGHAKSYDYAITEKQETSPAITQGTSPPITRGTSPATTRETSLATTRGTSPPTTSAAAMETATASPPVLTEMSVPPVSPASIKILEASAPGTKTKSSAHAILDYSNMKDGYVMVKRTGGVKGEVYITGPGMEVCERVFPLKDKLYYYPIPLAYGNGEYHIMVVVYANNEQFLSVLDTTLSVNITSSSLRYMLPNIYVDYNKSSDVVKKSFDLCNGSKTDLEKVGLIYGYIVDNFNYSLINEKEQLDYVPRLDSVLSSKKGVCIDIASIMTAMCRAQGIETKLVFGYSGNNYHAWVEVYTPQNGWERYDPTFALTMSKKQMSNLKYNAKEAY
jgi:transglutaminase-like putative cysteine protease